MTSMGECAFCDAPAVTQYELLPPQIVRKNGNREGVRSARWISVCEAHRYEVGVRRIPYELWQRIKRELRDEYWLPRQGQLFTPEHQSTPHHRKDVNHGS